jgi:hypothetical protein
MFLPGLRTVAVTTGRMAVSGARKGILVGSAHLVSTPSAVQGTSERGLVSRTYSVSTFIQAVLGAGIGVLMSHQQGADTISAFGTVRRAHQRIFADIADPVSTVCRAIIRASPGIVLRQRFAVLSRFADAVTTGRRTVPRTAVMGFTHPAQAISASMAVRGANGEALGVGALAIAARNLAILETEGIGQHLITSAHPVSAGYAVEGTRFPCLLRLANAVSAPRMATWIDVRARCTYPVLTDIPLRAVIAVIAWRSCQRNKHAPLVRNACVLCADIVVLALHNVPTRANPLHANGGFGTQVSV